MAKNPKNSWQDIDPAEFFESLDTALTEKHLAESVRESLARGISVKEIIDTVYQIVVETVMEE
jgi:fatty acid-binding protein DegV